MQWFRWYHGTVSDAKFGSIARKTGTSRALVVAVWAMILEAASDGEPRGGLHVDADGIADVLNEPTEPVASIFAEFEARGMIANGWVSAWQKRQPARDDSTERVRNWRAKQREERERAAAEERERNDVTRYRDAEATRETAADVETDSDTESTSQPARTRAREAPQEEPADPSQVDRHQGLSEWLGPYADRAFVAMARVSGQKAAWHWGAAMLTAFGPGGMEAKVWAEIAEAERPRILAAAIVRYAGEGNVFRAASFTPFLRTTLRQDGEADAGTGAYGTGAGGRRSPERRAGEDQEGAGAGYVVEDGSGGTRQDDASRNDHSQFDV